MASSFPRFPRTQDVPTDSWGGEKEGIDKRELACLESGTFSAVDMYYKHYANYKSLSLLKKEIELEVGEVHGIWYMVQPVSL